MTTKTKTKTKQSARDRMVEGFLSIIENSGGKLPWRRPWKTLAESGIVSPKGVVPGFPYNGNSKRPYSGINIWVLLARAAEEGWDPTDWYTFKGAMKGGGMVRKGEKGTAVCFWKVIEVKDDDGKPVIDPKTGEPEVRFFLRTYSVFNREQVDGLPSIIPATPEAEPEGEEVEVIEQDLVGPLIEAMGVSYREGGSRAAYNKVADSIRCPNQGRFGSFQEYQATLAHEAVHATGHKSRLEREFGERFGDKAYAFEELVAELGSTFVCAELGIDQCESVDTNHAAYLKHWASAIREDQNAIFTAAKQASKAADYLSNLSQKEADSACDSEAA